MSNFYLAGVGMVMAGLLFDKVQHWKVFMEVKGLFILVPPLLGLKGNLEMTLAARLSTAVSINYKLRVCIQTRMQRRDADVSLIINLTRVSNFVKVQGDFKKILGLF